MSVSLRHLSRPPQVYQLFRTMSTTGIKAGPVETAIQNNLLEGLMGEKSIHLEIVNESYKHNVAKDSESHFNVLVVTDAFEGLKIIERHRMINKLLAVELSTKIHALSIQAKTWAQFEANPTFSETPNCAGGSKR